MELSPRAGLEPGGHTPCRTASHEPGARGMVELTGAGCACKLKPWRKVDDAPLTPRVLQDKALCNAACSL